MSETLIKVEGVSKKFCRSLKKSLWYGMKDLGYEVTGRQHGGDGELRPDEFWAVKDVSFELKRGECMGLIGRNGAGKTTLLRILNGLIKPDSGRVELRGRVGALIALGAGFNPLLTGRENIYVNAAMLGLTKTEIENRLQQIIEFSGISEYIDSPMQNYSSGMQVRLGFAVTTALKPEILIIDEVLAVGDTEFKIKCYNKVRELLPHCAIILVSHAMHDIKRICSSGMVMQKGRVSYMGPTINSIKVYDELNSKKIEGYKTSYLIHRDDKVRSVEVIDYKTETKYFESIFQAKVLVDCTEDIGEVILRLVIHDDAVHDYPIAEWNSSSSGEIHVLNKGENVINIKACNIRLRSGIYRGIIAITDMGLHGFYVNIEYGIELAIDNQICTGAHYRI